MSRLKQHKKVLEPLTAEPPELEELSFLETEHEQLVEKESEDQRKYKEQNPSFSSAGT